MAPSWNATQNAIWSTTRNDAWNISCFFPSLYSFFQFFFWLHSFHFVFMTYLLNVGLRGHQSLLVSKKLTFNLSGNKFFFTFSYDLVWLMYLLICYNFKKKMLKILFTSNTTNRYYEILKHVIYEVFMIWTIILHK